MLAAATCHNIAPLPGSTYADPIWGRASKSKITGKMIVG